MYKPDVIRSLRSQLVFVCVAIMIMIGVCLRYTPQKSSTLSSCAFQQIIRSKYSKSNYECEIGTRD